MSNADIKTAPLDAPSGDRKKTWFAAGGVIGAILASTCCIAPLVLLTLERFRF
jgi:mercuric ion transport protein